MSAVISQLMPLSVTLHSPMVSSCEPSRVVALRGTLVRPAGIFRPSPSVTLKVAPWATFLPE